MSSSDEVICQVLGVQRMDMGEFKTLQFYMELDGKDFLVSFANLEGIETTTYHLAALNITITKYLELRLGNNAIEAKVLPMSPIVPTTKQ